MAHIAKLGALTDELITIITGTSSKNETSRFNAYHESALRSLRYQNYARTNQFDVADRLEGLEEKFRIYCEDPLADALRERVDELKPRSNKWTPEILHLLLELSDRPVEKSTVESLDLLYPPREPTPPPLTWKEIVADDPLMRDKIWRNIDYAAESSDEGEYLDSNTENLDDNETTDLSSVDDQEFLRSEELIQNVDAEILDVLLRAQFWGSEDGSTSLQAKPLTELQAVREVLYMLHGLPTSMFVIESDTVLPLQIFRLKHASRAMLAQHLSTFAKWGTSTSYLRAYVQQKNDIPLLQCLQSAISKWLEKFDATLSALEQDYLAPQDDQVVSLLAVEDMLREPIQHLSKLSDIVQRLNNDQYAPAFRYLEFLYDETCVAQMAGNDEMYRFLGVLFFECFQVYLRPIRQWMEDGYLSEDDRVFFVAPQHDESVAPALLWECRYELRQTLERGLYAPQFIHTATDRIFNTGKSIVVLQHLGRYETLKASWTTAEPKLNFDIVCGDSSLELAPFSALFDVSFANWIQSKHHFTSTTLQRCLFEDCSLWASIQALETIYFMRDGASSSFLASTIFSKLDSLKDSWNDSFSLTELAQSTYASTPFIIGDRIRAISSGVKNNDLLRSRRSVKNLSSIAVEYRLSWPVQLIITPNTLPSYQRVFTFLLQIRRSSNFLNTTRLSQDIDNQHSSAEEKALYYSTRARLLWFTNLLHNYITDIVLEKCTFEMRTQLRKAEDIDEMITIHRKSVKKIEDQALLGRKLGPIHKSIISLLDLSIQLVDARNAHLAGKDPEAGSAKVDWDSDSEPEEEDSFAEKVVVKVSYGEELSAIRKRYESLIRFVASGLRGVARVGKEGVGVWDILAEKIEAGLVPSNEI